MSGEMLRLRAARESDLGGVAEVFHAGFPESVAHIYGEGRRPPAELTASLFRVCLRSEPEAFLVVVDEAAGGRVAGYIFAPAALSRVWKVALLRGYVLRWAWGWLSGRYGLGWRPVQLALHNKLAFVRNAATDRLKVDARILSIAVHPDYQGKGLARRLCEPALARLDRLGVQVVRLEVRPWNAPAVHLYTSLGFRRVGAMVDSQGEWWVMLRRSSQRIELGERGEPT